MKKFCLSFQLHCFTQTKGARSKSGWTGVQAWHVMLQYSSLYYILALQQLYLTFPPWPHWLFTQKSTRMWHLISIMKNCKTRVMIGLGKRNVSRTYFPHLFPALIFRTYFPHLFLALISRTYFSHLFLALISRTYFPHVFLGCRGIYIYIYIYIYISIPKAELI